MQEQIIRLCYRKIINASSPKAWERYVFDDTYSEFILQAQFFNQDKKYRSFAEILHQVPGADQLHFLVSAAITGYVEQLQQKTPDITNSLGKLFLSFKHYRFEIINSDISEKGKHQVAINFYSEPLTWLATIGNQLLVTSAHKTEIGERLTDMFSMQPFLSIHSIQ
jgi:hypothetical protein